MHWHGSSTTRSTGTCGTHIDSLSSKSVNQSFLYHLQTKRHSGQSLVLTYAGQLAALLGAVISDNTEKSDSLRSMNFRAFRLVLNRFVVTFLLAFASIKPRGRPVVKRNYLPKHAISYQNATFGVQCSVEVEPGRFKRTFDGQQPKCFLKSREKCCARG
jgi:hypothetical protein